MSHGESIYKNFNLENVKLHNSYANEWWDPKSVYRGLNLMNKLRIPLVIAGLERTGMIDSTKEKLLEGLKILDVGCGVGFLTEPLARMKANVTGLDLGEDLLKAAKAHLSLDTKIADSIEYRLETIEEHAKNNPGKYDVVVSSEVLEHVVDQRSFLKACTATLKPGGSIFLTTINKTLASRIITIFLYENVVRIVPRGTHQWDLFISPQEVEKILAEFNCKTLFVRGTYYKWWRPEFIWSPEWEWCNTQAMTYVLHAVKNEFKIPLTDSTEKPN